jgi:para-aminobenzoate synthetase component 1
MYILIQSCTIRNVAKLKGVHVMKTRYILATKILLQECNWFNQYKYLSQKEPYHILLESGRDGKYSIIGLHPFAILRGKNNKLYITQDGVELEKKGNPFLLMKEWMNQYSLTYNPDYPDFQGGAIGYITYDCVRHFEKLENKAEDDLELPDLYFLMFKDTFVYDHESSLLWIITQYDEGEKEIAARRLQEYKNLWLNKDVNDFSLNVQSQPEEDLRVSMTEAEFIKAVEKIKNYISQGDIFQVNLSVRQTKPLKTHPFSIYEQLRELNPSPYMAYLQLPEFQIVSSSPELLVKKKGDVVHTRPIAGTRSRGKTNEEDIQLAKELIENEKERAEHVMLVDLERNDLGRVCKYGTVEVNEFMVIEKYSHVMHIVSNIRGTLQPKKDAFDIIKAVFPGGTITGAPKVRTMEIIEELEPVRRGIYTGSIGWIGFNGDMELNIVIRTLLAKDGLVHVQAGAGVVIDSNPKNEYKESLKKAIALWRAKELSEKKMNTHI